MFIITVPIDVALKIAKELLSSWIFLAIVFVICVILPLLLLSCFGGGFLLGAGTGIVAVLTLLAYWSGAALGLRETGKSRARCHLRYGILVLCASYATYFFTPPANFLTAQHTRSWWDEFITWRAALQTGHHSPELITQTYRLRSTAIEVDSTRLERTWLSRGIPALDFNRAIHQDDGKVILFDGRPITRRATQLDAIRDTLLAFVPEERLPLYVDMAPTLPHRYGPLRDITGTPTTVHHLGELGDGTVEDSLLGQHAAGSLKEDSLPGLQTQCQLLFNRIRLHYRLQPYHCIPASQFYDWQAIAYAATDIRNLTSLFYERAWRQTNPGKVDGFKRVACPPEKRFGALPVAQQDSWIDSTITSAQKQRYVFSFPAPRERDVTMPALQAFPFAEPPFPLPGLDETAMELTPPPDALRRALLDDRFAPWVK